MFKDKSFVFVEIFNEETPKELQSSINKYLRTLNDDPACYEVIDIKYEISNHEQWDRSYTALLSYRTVNPEAE